MNDHLGNTRVVVNDSGRVLQRSDYYAFGLALDVVDRAVNKYTYNGKELQPETNLLDYGARQYDAAVGRWFGIDPLAMLDFGDSPYIYCSNNPINRIDLFGLTDKNKDGIEDEEIYLHTVVVKGKRPQPASDPVFGDLWRAYDRNIQKYGHSSPYQEHFQAGGRDAALFVSAPLAAIGAAEAGAGALIFESEVLTSIKTLSFGRGLLRTMLAKGGINILGQSVGGMLSGDFAKGTAKFDMVGLFADMTFTNGAASVTGGVGEGGIMYDSKEGLTRYGTVNSPFLGLSKFSVGFGFGHIGGKATEFMGANGFSNTVIGLYESISKIFNESIDQVNSKFDEKISPEKNENGKK